MYNQFSVQTASAFMKLLPTVLSPEVHQTLPNNPIYTHITLMLHLLREILLLHSKELDLYDVNYDFKLFIYFL